MWFLIDLIPALPLGWVGATAAGTAAVYAALASAAVGGYSAYASSQAQKDQAKQQEFNAEAKRDELVRERQRKAAELATNQKRLAVQERRERATQFSAMANSGLAATTGTPLAIMGDTLTAQAERRSDMLTAGRLDQWELDAAGNSVMQEGRSEARALRGQAGATLLSGLANTASSGVNTYKGLR